MDEIQKKDKAFVWHPFTHLKYAEIPINIIHSEGAYYFDAEGTKYIDGIASWWVNLHGHSHPYIAKKVYEQLQTNAHSMFSGFTHPAAVNLSERLLKHLAAFSKIFFSDDGSTAVEVSLKMALQYWHNKNEKRTTIIAFEDAYHGDTFGGMSVGARNVFTHAFSSLLFQVVRLPLPNEKNHDEVKRQLEKYISKNNTAAFIFEPLVQGAAGMKMYDAQYLDELISICKTNNIITIADEVMTGFGRSGKTFAIDYLTHKPDIICLSKGLTGGVMPLGVTACAEFIYEACLQDDKTKTFFHGHSYTANPTACSAALASLDLLEKEESKADINRITDLHFSFYNKVRSHRNVLEARFKGTVLAIEVRTPEASGYMNSLSEYISSYFIERKIILRPLGNVLYVLPPYCISTEDLQYIYHCIEAFLDELK